MTSDSNSGVNSDKHDEYSTLFDSAVALWGEEDRQQEAVDILFELAHRGHIPSVKELFYVFTEQEDFEIASTILNHPAVDQDDSTTLYLKAELENKQGKFDLTAFAKAVEAGSAMAALKLVEHYLNSNRAEAKKWFARAEQIGHKFLPYYLELIEFMPRKKCFILLVGSDETDTYLEVRVYQNGNQQILKSFNSLEAATEFCLGHEAGFEVRYVGDDWLDNTDLDTNNTYELNCKVIRERDLVIVRDETEILWHGEMSELWVAVEYLINNAEKWWELIYCDYDEYKNETEFANFEEPDSILFNEGVLVAPLELVGKFKVESGVAMVGDPSHLVQWPKDENWRSIIRQELDSNHAFEYSFRGAYETAMSSELNADALENDLSVVFRTYRLGEVSVYAKFNDEGRIVKVVIDLEATDSDLTSGVVVEDLQYIATFRVESGQAIVGDPCYLNEWQNNQEEDWDLEGKVGQYSYFGACATTIADSAGELENGKAVAFNTGYGDGYYAVYAEVLPDSDFQLTKIIIDFAPGE